MIHQSQPSIDYNALKDLAREIRLDILESTTKAGSGHPSSCWSAVEILVALFFARFSSRHGVLYRQGILRYHPEDPWWPERDRFIMSKGHSVPAQYVALAMAGIFPLDELATLKELGSRLQGHPAMHFTPGLEGCTGSLGQGLSFANGMALAARIKGLSYRVYCLLGDGELHEGQVWEAAMTASRCGLSNLTAIVDANRLKAMDDASTCCKPLAPVAERWAGFGWFVRDIDGHHMAEICSALDWASSVESGPAVVVAHTVKGKGVSFIENQPGFHNSSLSDEQYAKAVAELEANLEARSEAIP